MCYSLVYTPAVLCLMLFSYTDEVPILKMVDAYGL